MNPKSIAVLPLALLVSVSVSDIGARQRTRALKTEREVRSYALGMDVGNQFRKLSIDVDPAIFAKGMGDALSGRETLMSDSEAKQAIARVQVEYKSRQIQASATTDAATGATNSRAGEAFLAENSKRPGVATLPSGLQYKVLVNGTGPKPTAQQTVVCNYRGTLIDGTEFDSSFSRKEPASFAVSAVIPGWTEALQLMPVGSKWQLFIPGKLAYGERGMPPKIGPDATLVFELELLAIK